MVSSGQVEQTLRTFYDEPVSLNQLTSSVYEINKPKTGDFKYAKTWSSERKSILETLVDIDTEIGMPRSELVTGDACIQLMEPVPGRKLSTTLLTHLPPGVWKLSQKKMIRIFRSIGRKVGRFHSITSGQSDSLEFSNLHLDKYDAVRDGQLAQSLQEILDERVITRINLKLKEYEGSLFRTSIVHGDLMLFHLYTHNEDVSLIDFDRAWRANPLEDLATFKSALDLFIRRLPYGKHSQYNRFVEAFDQGYAKIKPDTLRNLELSSVLKTIRDCSLLLYYIDNLSGNIPYHLRLLRRYDSYLLQSTINNRWRH